MQTVWDHIRLAADRTPDQVAMVDDRSDKTLTFSGLVEEVDAVAAGLASLDIGSGDRVATDDETTAAVAKAVVGKQFRRVRKRGRALNRSSNTCASRRVSAS